MRTILPAILLIPCLLFAQTEQGEDVWSPFRILAGEWEGTGGTGSARSRVEARYGFVLNDRYLEVAHRAVFDPHEGRPEGEIHEDRGFISYDRYRKKFVFRQFHGEGFVNSYVLDSLSTDGKTFVFDSEQIENAPHGTRANLTITICGPDEIVTTFNVAFPGKEYRCYSENRLIRKK